MLTVTSDQAKNLTVDGSELRFDGTWESKEREEVSRQ